MELWNFQILSLRIFPTQGSQALIALVLLNLCPAVLSNHVSEAEATDIHE